MITKLDKISDIATEFRTTLAAKGRLSWFYENKNPASPVQPVMAGGKITDWIGYDHSAILKPKIIGYKSTTSTLKLFFDQSKLDTLVESLIDLETGQQITTYQISKTENVEHFFEIKFNSSATNFERCFALSDLSTIPGNLFDGHSNIQRMYNCFWNIKATSIPYNLLHYCPNLLYANSLFENCKITEIPDGLFDMCPKITSFNSCFYGCVMIKYVPHDLFHKNINAQNFGHTFYHVGMETYPNDLFYKNVNANTFNNCFGNNNNLKYIPDDFFINIPQKANFGYSFSDCTNLTGQTPTINSKKMWEYFNNGTGCFKNCRNLNDYDEIPDTWK